MPETSWVDGDVATAAKLNQIEDQIVVTCTSSTRPTGVEGRLIYETDTNNVMIFDGGGWNVFGAAEWVDFSPTFNNCPTSSTDGMYRYADGGLFVQFSAVLSGAVTGTVTVPLPNSETSRTSGLRSIGTVWLRDSSGGDIVGTCSLGSGSGTITLYDETIATVSASNPHTWASGDLIDGQIFIPL